MWHNNVKHCYDPIGKCAGESWHRWFGTKSDLEGAQCAFTPGNVSLRFHFFFFSFSFLNKSPLRYSNSPRTYTIVLYVWTQYGSSRYDQDLCFDLTASVCNSCNWIWSNTLSHKGNQITSLLMQPGGSATASLLMNVKCTNCVYCSICFTQHFLLGFLSLNKYKINWIAVNGKCNATVQGLNHGSPTFF